MELYSQFISKFEARINQVRLAVILSMIGQSLSDADEAASFFERILTNRARLGEDATICIEMDIVLTRIRQGRTSEAKDLLEETKKKITTLTSSESIVFSKFYWAAAQFRKVHKSQ